MSAETDKKLDGAINMFLSGIRIPGMGRTQRIRIWQNNYTLSFIVHHNHQRDFSAAFFIGAGCSPTERVP